MLQDAQLTARRIWGALSWTQRITIFALTGGVIAAVALLAMWAGQPTYGVLFSGLAANDASAIVTQLDASKTPYQLANGGDTILVPQNMVDSERLQLASQNLPSGGTVGFDLFDKQNLLQSDSFVEQINYTRALEGELTRTIGQVAGVAYARVNIVLPQQQLFSSEQADPTASVLLKLTPGADLSADQVNGIQHLVASAVERLKPDNVTVVSGDGTILSGNNGSSVSVTGLTAMQAQERYASNLEAQLTAMLSTIVGPDKAVVRVNDVMDWTQREATSNTYQSQQKNSPLQEEHVITSTNVGPAASVGGIVGVASNVPKYGTKSQASGNTTAANNNIDRLYAVGNTVSHVVQAPGQVTRISVAVLLDGVKNRAELKQLQQAVVNAAGLNLKRGDQISISSVPFDKSVATAATQAATQQQQQALIVSIVRWAALLVVPLILLVLLWRLLMPPRRKAKKGAELPAPPTVQVMEPRTALLEAAATPPLLPAQEMSPSRTNMIELAREKPEVVAGLIGRWIEEDRG